MKTHLQHKIWQEFNIYKHRLSPINETEKRERN